MVRTAELAGDDLVLAVARCEHKHIRRWTDGRVQFLHPNTDWTDFKLDWSQGGPIIKRERIIFMDRAGRGYAAFRSGDSPPYMEGPDHLIAAMRCYVASKLGDEIDIPKELLND